MTGMREWRMQYPKATLRQIETELDTGLARMRARMLEELALQSTAATWQEQARLQAPTCPQYGTPLDERGTHPRTLLTHGGQELILERSYAVCPTCNSGLFPLDDESGLLPGQLTPRLQEGLVRLSTHIASFGKAATEFAFWSQVTLARSTARRLTEAAAATAVAYQTAEADRILRECPPAPAGPEQLVFSVDGAMVPLLHASGPRCVRWPWAT